jgi:hypothetical protein
MKLTTPLFSACVLLASTAQAVSSETIPLKLVSSSLTAENAVSFTEPFSFRFNSPLACESATEDWITIHEKNSLESVPGRILCKENRLTFVPEIQLSWFPSKILAGSQSSWRGLRANHSYTATISSQVLTPDGTHISAPQERTFTMEALDYGIYWIDISGRGERKFDNIENPFVLPLAPTMVFFHGRQSGAVADDLWRGNPFLKTNLALESENLLPSWKAQNFNTGIYFWEQFSDEKEVKDIERKLWNTPKRNEPGIPYLNGLAQPSQLKNDRRLVDILCDHYLKNVREILASDLRIVAHSIGSQVSIHCAWRSIADGAGNNIPSRLTLLDPFWGKGTKNTPAGEWTGAIAERELSELLSKSPIAVEQYKSSALGGLIGDANLPIRKLTSFVRIWPRFLSKANMLEKHNYGIMWYMESMKAPVPVIQGGSLGAAAANSTIRDLMNSPSKPLHFFSGEGGTYTPDVSDDTLTQLSGVDTW